MRKKDHNGDPRGFRDTRETGSVQNFQTAAALHLTPDHKTGMQMLEETACRIFGMLYPVIGKNVVCTISYDETLKEYLVQFSARSDLNPREHARTLGIIFDYLSEQKRLPELNAASKENYYYFDWEIDPDSGKVYADTKHDLLKFFTQHLVFKKKAGFDIYTKEGILPEDHGQALQKYLRHVQNKKVKDPSYEQKLLARALPRSYQNYPTYLAVSEKLVEDFDKARCNFSEFSALTEEIIRLEELHDPDIEEHYPPSYILN